MSFSYDEIPDSKDVIQANKNDKRIRTAFWQEEYRTKKGEPRDSSGSLLCSKCVAASRYVGSNIEIGYDTELQSIVKICTYCSDKQVLEAGIAADDTEEENKESEISPGGTAKEYPLFAATLVNSSERRDKEGIRRPTPLSSNQGLDDNTIRDITSAMGSSPSSGGPTFNERMNWGRRKFISSSGDV
jgi:hypothetical protein